MKRWRYAACTPLPRCASASKTDGHNAASKRYRPPVESHTRWLPWRRAVDRGLSHDISTPSRAAVHAGGSGTTRQVAAIRSLLRTNGWSRSCDVRTCPVAPICRRRRSCSQASFTTKNKLFNYILVKYWITKNAKAELYLSKGYDFCLLLLQCICYVISQILNFGSCKCVYIIELFSNSLKVLIC